MKHEEFEQLIATRAVGAMSPEEERLLDEHLRACADCRTEDRTMRETAAAIALDAPAVAPPPAVKQQLFARIEAAPHEMAAPAPVVRRRQPAWIPWVAAAALLIAFGWALTSARRAERRTDALTERLLASEKRAAESESRAQELQSLIEALAAAPSIQLSGQDAAPSASARIFMNPANRTAIVFFNDLPPSGSGNSYQLWVIRADRPEPQSAGVFEVGPDGRATLGLKDLPTNTEIKAFAVTLEPKGGVAAPTGKKFLVGS